MVAIAAAKYRISPDHFRKYPLVVIVALAVGVFLFGTGAFASL